MTATTTARPSRLSPARKAFDPARAWLLTHAWDEAREAIRLRIACPSSRPHKAPHVLSVDDGGERPSCECEGYVHHGHCTHAEQGEAIAKHAAGDYVVSLRPEEVQALDRFLLDCYGATHTGPSFLRDAVGDQVARLLRRADPTLLRQRGQEAVNELFG